MPNPGIKDEGLYRELREQGDSREKAARIANAAAAQGRDEVGAKGGHAGSYADWTVERLRKRAGELDIGGRSSMSKDELVKALREH